MIDDFFEKSISRKLLIIDLLTSEKCSILDLVSSLKVNRMTLLKDLEEMGLIINDSKGHNSKKIQIKYDFFENELNIIHLKKSIYKKSLFLKMLVFYLKNNYLSLEEFPKKYYISAARYYQVRLKVIQYLKSLDFSFGKNGIQGDEIRIRFFYVFIQIKTGERLISEHDSYYWNSIVKKSNYLYKLNFSDLTVNIATLLFTIGMTRKDKEIFIEPFFLKTIRNTSIYNDIKENLGKQLNIFEDSFVDYYIVALYFLDSNVLDQVFADMILSCEYSLFLNKYSLKLLLKIQEKYTFNNSKFLSLIILNFFRKAQMNLQPFLIEDEVSNTDENYNIFYSDILSIVNEWNSKIAIPYKFSEAHLQRFIFQLYQILSPKNNKLIKIVTNNYFDFFVVEQQLNRAFSKYKFTIDNFSYSSIKEAITNTNVGEDFLVIKIVNSNLYDNNLDYLRDNVVLVSLKLSKDNLKEIENRLLK